MPLRTRYAGEVQDADFGTKQTLAGWVQDVRLLGSIAFLVLRDRTGIAQVTVLKKKQPDLFAQVQEIPRESVVAVTGELKRSDKANLGWEILPERLDVLAKAESPLPMGVVDRVGVDLDTRLDNRFLDLRRAETQAIFKIRHTTVGAAHEYLRKDGFVEVHTSNINAASSEGGTQVFRFQYFEKQAFLSQSPQLYKQMMMATGLDRVYEIARYFRAEEHNTRRHLNESTAIDLEMAFIESEEDVLKVIEGLIHHIWKRVSEQHTAELKTLERTVEAPPLPFPRLTYTHVLERLADRGTQLEWGSDIGTEEERLLGEIMKQEGHDFYFITQWPLAAKPFYVMPARLDNGQYPSDAKALSTAFDLDCKGVELLSGAQRIHRVDLLEEGLKRVDLNPADFKAYLTAFRYGMPPHGGFGLGIERILMEMLEIPNIRETILFPRDRTRLYP